MKTRAKSRLDLDAAAAPCLVAAALVAVACSAAPSAAEPSFYAGKQITFIAGSGVGGGYDLLARLTARHLGRLIPGHPTIVVQNMPAAGSLVATNQIYNSAPKDGTVIALVQRGMLLAKLTNPSAVRFELEKLNWLGNLNSETGLVLAWHTAPHRRAEDLFEQELIVGGQTGVDPEITPRLYNALIGTKFKIVTGYNGTAEIALAIERGEVQGIGDWSWASFKKQRPDWLRDKKVTLLMQGALQRDPDLPDLPSALDFVKSDADRKVMELFFTQKTIARPVIAPPGLPAERLQVLGAAFAALAGGCAILGRRRKIRSGCRADCRRCRRQGGYADRRHAGRAGRSLRKDLRFAGPSAVKDSHREEP
ncbi:MAG: Bug family tripartite tricarboxylate transporter substrate binding protein [Xanthobacteraceae bacterium]